MAMTYLLSSLSGFLHKQVAEVNDLSTLRSFKPGIAKCLTSQEVDEFVKTHIKFLQWKIKEKNTSEAEAMIILKHSLMCKAFGHDVSFIAIHAVQLAQSSQVLSNRNLAYTACNEVLRNIDGMRIMMVSTIQRDLQSSQSNSVQMALTAVSEIVPDDYSDALYDDIRKRTKHTDRAVRRKALVCLKQITERQPEHLEVAALIFRSAISDTDVSVMFVAVQAFIELDLPLSQTDKDVLLDALLYIIKQFVHKEMPQYHRGGVNGPFVLLKLITLLIKLYKEDESKRLKILHTLLSIMDTYEVVATNNAVAVVAECCMSVPLFTEESIHLQRVTRYAISMVNKDNDNLKAVGLKIMGVLALQDKSLLMPHHNLIVKELRSKDRTIVTRALILMLQFTSASTIKQVFELFGKFVSGNLSTQDYQQYACDILTCCDLKELDKEWYLTKLLEVVGQGCLSQTTLEKLLRYFSDEKVSKELFEVFKERISVEQSTHAMIPLLLLLVCLYSASRSQDDISQLILDKLQSTAVAGSFNYLSHLLILLKSSLTSHISMTTDQIEVLGQHFSKLPVICELHVHIQESHTLANSNPTLEKGIDLDALWLDMDDYTNKLVASESCRFVKKKTTRSSALLFSRQPDTKQDGLEDAEGETDGKPQVSKRIWTDQGLQEDDNSVDDETNGDNNTDDAPKDEMELLASQIFQGK